MINLFPPGGVPNPELMRTSSQAKAPGYSDQVRERQEKLFIQTAEKLDTIEERFIAFGEIFYPEDHLDFVAVQTHYNDWQDMREMVFLGNFEVPDVMTDDGADTARRLLLEDQAEQF